VQSQKLLDIGSGAGFPAIPIKISHPEIAVTLVESTKKKATFLRHIIRTLQCIGVEVIDTRIGELSETYHGTFDIVTARAFSDISSAISTGSPFLKPGGLIILSRGPNEALSKRELEASSVTLEQRLDFFLPQSDNKRAIWVLRKK